MSVISCFTLVTVNSMHPALMYRRESTIVSCNGVGMDENFSLAAHSATGVSKAAPLCASSSSHKEVSSVIDINPKTKGDIPLCALSAKGAGPRGISTFLSPLSILNGIDRDSHCYLYQH